MSNAAEKTGVTRMLSVVACFVIVVAGMKAAGEILVPFLLAVFIAIISTPLFLGLRRRGVPAGIALGVMILILAAVGFAGVGVLRTSLSGFNDNLDKYQTNLKKQTAHVWERLEEIGMDPPDQVVSDALNPQVAMSYLGTVTSTLGNLLSKAFLILLVVVFILLEAAVLPAKIRSLPGLSDSTWARLCQIVEDIRRYMLLKTIMSLATGVSVALLTAVIGVDYPILLGLLAFTLNYVPNIGSFVAAIPGVLLAFIEFGPGIAAVTVVGYVVVNVTISNVIEPRFLGRGLGLSPLVILISMIFWGWVLGPVGMLLSVPLTMAVKIVMESGDDTKWIALLMGAGPGGSSPNTKAA